MIFKNPEFKKNLKLEFSTARALTPAIILLLAAWIGWISARESNYFSLPPMYANAKSMTSTLFGFGFIFSIVWGSYLASNSLLSEMRQKTWDFMRMSSLAPEKILLGKLFGAPASVWTISILGILPVIIQASQYLFPDGGYYRPVSSTLVSLTGSMFFWMIFSYSFVMLVGVYTYAKEARHTAVGTVLLVLVSGLYIGAFIMAGYFQESSIREACRNFKPTFDIPYCKDINIRTIEGVNYTSNDIRTTNWYESKVLPLDMIFALMFYAAVWSVIGLYRSLRTSLQYRDAPLIWPIFLLMTAFVLNGFGYGDRADQIYLRYATYFFAVSIMIVGIQESRNIVNYKKLWENLKIRDYKEAFRLTPLWMISFATFIIGAPLIFLCAGTLAPYVGRYGVAPATFTSDPFVRFSFFYVSMLLLAMRDIMVLHLISWRKGIKSPAVAFVIYLLIVYILIPLILQKAIPTAAQFVTLSSMPIVQMGNNAIVNMYPTAALGIQLATALGAFLLLKKKIEENKILK